MSNKIKRNVWLLPYSNFQDFNYNPSKGLAVQVKKALLAKQNYQYVCRIKRVGVNIYDADEAIDEVEFLDNSGLLSIDVVIAFGLGQPDKLFKFEHTGTAKRNGISGQNDFCGRRLEKTLQEYGDISLEGKVAGWYSNQVVRDLTRTYEKRAGQREESSTAGDYLCAYMTEKLAVSPTLTNKGFFIHTKDYKPTQESTERDEAGHIIADFIEAFCDLKLKSK